MFKRARTQLSFFDAIYDRTVPPDHFLRQLKALIAWSQFQPLFDPLYPTGVGRRAHNPVLMWQACVLQFLYDLSDRALEDQLNDRMSFRYFLGLEPTASVPDHTTYCRFRDRLGAATIARLFNAVVDQARTHGLVTDRLCIVDATHVQARVDTYRMRQDRDDAETGFGVPPSVVDPEARYGHKSASKPFFGYRVAIGLDRDSHLITRVTATSGNMHDSLHFPLVADPHARAVTADKGYDTPENFLLLRERGQAAAIHVKRRRGRQRGHIQARYPDRAAYQQYYRLKRDRPQVERLFAIAKQWYGLHRARYWGLAKMQVQALMTMLAINLKRMVVLTPQFQT